MTLSKNNVLKIQILIKKYNNKNKNDILKEVHRIANENNPMDRTISARYSNIKKMFNNVIKDEDFISKIKPDEKITLSVIKKNNEKRDNRKLIIINKNILDKIKSFRNSDDIYDLAIYLLFVSGRRTAELLEGKYSNKPKTPYIYINGIKKRRSDTKGIFIPIILKTKFLNLMRKFKLLYKNLKLKPQSFSRQLNRKIKSKIDNDLHPHNLRGLYAFYMFSFNNSENLKINTYIKNVLLHQSINSSLSYTQYKFAKDIKKMF